ncbi:MAG: hypothetical protein JWP01_2542 [Myxococcales bacterium]|nr:hypothetical protein [Myxococcales bacterium]
MSPLARAAAIALLLARTVAAQPAPEPQPLDQTAKLARAAELYDAGRRAFDIAEYPAAIANWKEAYLLSSAPLLLFNIAQAHRLSGNCAQANRFYLNYKRVEPRPQNQAELDAAMASCAGIEPAVGDAAPPPAPVEPPPVVALIEPPLTVPAERAKRDGDPGRTYKIAGYIAAGIGGTAGIVAIVSTVGARNKANTIERLPAGTPWTPALRQTERDGKSAQTRARVFGLISVAAVAAGGALWWHGWTTSRSRTHVDVSIGPGATEVFLSCVF